MARKKVHSTFQWHFPSLRSLLLLPFSFACLAILRYWGLGMNPVAIFCARAATIALCCAAVRKEPSPMLILIFCVTIPFYPWAVDLADGDMAFVYGIAATIVFFLSVPVFTSAKAREMPGQSARAPRSDAVFAQGRIAPLARNPFLPVPFQALALAFLTALGVAFLLVLRREMSPFAALLYALPRQILPATAYLAGLLTEAFLFSRSKRS